VFVRGVTAALLLLLDDEDGEGRRYGDDATADSGLDEVLCASLVGDGAVDGRLDLFAELNLLSLLLLLALVLAVVLLVAAAAVALVRPVYISLHLGLRSLEKTSHGTSTFHSLHDRTPVHVLTHFLESQSLDLQRN